jgi:hypothetical protein
MKKLLLSTFILATSLMQAPLPGRQQPVLAPTQNQPAQNQPAQQQTTQNQPTTNNPYDADIEAIDKEIKNAAQKGSVNPTDAQEKALTNLNNKLQAFVKDFCPITSGKFTFNNKISLEIALATLDKFESLATRIHTDLSKNDSIFVVVYPKWYCDKAKKAHKTILDIQTIKNDISPSNYFVKKFKDGKKWVFASKTNFALTIAAAMAASATTRCLFKEHNGWIQPVISAGTAIGSNVLLPIFKYITWQ